MRLVSNPLMEAEFNKKRKPLGTVKYNNAQPWQIHRLEVLHCLQDSLPCAKAHYDFRAANKDYRKGLLLLSG